MTDKVKETLFSKFYNKAKVSAPKTLTNASQSTKIKYLIFGITLLICTVFFTINLNPSDEGNMFSDVHAGDKWSKQTIIAPFSFPIYKDKKVYEEEVTKAKENTLPVFTQFENAAENANLKVDTLILYSTRDYQFAKKYYESVFSMDMITSLETFPPDYRQKLINQVFFKIKQFYKKIYRFYIIDTNLTLINHDIISVYIPPNFEKHVKKNNLIDYKYISDLSHKEFFRELTELQRNLASEFLDHNFTPSLEYSPKMTEEAKELAVTNVAKTEGFVRQGEEIIAKSQIITPEIARKLKSYNKFYSQSSSNNITFWILLGNLGHASIIFLILLLYLFIIRKKIYSDNLQVGILNGVIVIVAAVSWLSMQIKTTLPIEYFIFLPGLSMLVAIAFDSRTAFYVTVTMSLMLAGVRGNDYDTGTAMMFSGILAAYSVRDIQSRTQLFRSMLFIMIGFAISIVAFSLERTLEIVPTMTKLFVAFLNSALSPLITFGLLIILERFTNITTDLKLDEFSKLNHPILVKLSEMAPGTYQHTVTVALMAEKCARAIDANALLAKVGAYFHDIGKLQRPEYFAENQINFENKHDMLTPRKSAESIKVHVMDGVRIAKEYNLPQRIIDFIPMHHGTSIIKHFYAKALEDAMGMPIDENDFRYPGPKPNSKETAIVMICDSAEAISRLTGKTKEEMEKIIDNSIQSRFLDGQFDECNITLKDLQVIKETCVKYLYASQHQRVEYKEIPGSIK